jgi:glycosyltransferase involved in cell wall biosynthesis
MPAPTRVLVLNERDPRHPRAGGAEVHLAELGPRLAARGFALTQLACGFRGAPPREELPGLAVRRLGPLAGYYPRAALACARETRRGRFDLVLEVLCKLPFFSPLYARAPVLALCHHLLGETAFLQAPWPIAAAVVLSERLVPRLYGRTPFVADSASTRDDLVARGVAGERIRVIHLGTRPRPPRAQPLPPGLRVAYLGRLVPYKRVDVLLRAAARLVPRFPELELAVIGRGPEQPRLERLAARLGLASRTRFAGFASDAERDALLAGARVCVCPSRKEGFGLTVIEANALGVPVVATDAPGLRDSVRDGETGFLAPDGDAEAFADRIGRVLGDPALAARLSEGALAWSRRFDWERTADELAGSLEAARRGA